MGPSDPLFLIFFLVFKTNKAHWIASAYSQQISWDDEPCVLRGLRTHVEVPEQRIAGGGPENGRIHYRLLHHLSEFLLPGNVSTPSAIPYQRLLAKAPN